MNMITKPLFSFFVASVLLCVWMDVANGMMSIQLIPQYPIIQGSVTLSITGITGKYASFSWYKGSKADSNYAILSSIPALAEELVIKGPQYNSRMTPHPNGSLQISNLITKDEGNYTVKIQAEKANYIHVYLNIYELSGNDYNFPILGFVSGSVVLLVFVAVLAVLFARHRRQKKCTTQDISEMQPTSTKNDPVYENMIADQSNTNETDLPGITVLPSQESHYEQLAHKDKAVYSTL